MGTEEEVIVPLRAPSAAAIAPLTHVRSTLVSASLMAMTSRGLSDAYFAKLPPALHATVRTLVAGAWVPLEIAQAHYQAVDALGLSAQDAFAIGGEVGDRVQASLLGVVFRLAKGTGATPWSAIRMYPRLWDRVFQGGDNRVVSLGPKEARIENYGVGLCRYQYFRNAWRGLVCTGMSLFCRKAFVHEVVAQTTSTKFVFRASWA